MPLTLELWDDKHSYQCHLVIDRNNLIVKFPPKPWIPIPQNQEETQKLTKAQYSILGAAFLLRQEYSVIADVFSHLYDEDVIDMAPDDHLHLHTDHMSSHDKEGFHHHLAFKNDVTNDLFQHFLRFINKNWWIKNSKGDLLRRVSEDCFLLNSTIAAKYFSAVKVNQDQNEDVLKPAIKIEQYYREEKRKNIDWIAYKLQVEKEKKELLSRLQMKPTLFNSRNNSLDKKSGTNLSLSSRQMILRLAFAGFNAIVLVCLFAILLKMLSEHNKAEHIARFKM